MTPDHRPDDFSIFVPPRAKRPGLGARHILFAGVAGAGLLGVGLGLWARPAMNERQATAPTFAVAEAPKAPLGTRKLEIVVDDRPAPGGAPIDVLPAGPAPRLWTPPATEPEPQAPVRPPEGLVRVEAVTSPAPQTAPPRPKPAAKANLAPLVVAAAKPKPVTPKAKPPAVSPVRLARAEAPPPPKAAHSADLARAAAAKAAAHRIELAKAAKAAEKIELAKAARAEKIEAAKAEKIELARAAKAEKIELARAARAQKLELARAARLEKQQKLQLAQAEAKGRAEARAEAKAQALADARDDARKRIRLASLVHPDQRDPPHQTKPHAKAPAEAAKVDGKHARKARHEPPVERASLKAPKAPRVVERPTRARAAPPAPPAHASGLMRVSTPRCASPDPGEALVCADPSLGAADRQMTRAYQGARAAGVSDAQLQHQQQRWLAARSAAAREAPWAVHDVYLARIAELNGLAKEAHGDGH